MVQPGVLDRIGVVDRRGQEGEVCVLEARRRKDEGQITSDRRHRRIDTSRHRSESSRSSSSKAKRRVIEPNRRQRRRTDRHSGRGLRGAVSFGS